MDTWINKNKFLSRDCCVQQSSQWLFLRDHAVCRRANETDGVQNLSEGQSTTNRKVTLWSAVNQSARAATGANRVVHSAFILPLIRGTESRENICIADRFTINRTNYLIISYLTIRFWRGCGCTYPLASVYLIFTWSNVRMGFYCHISIFHILKVTCRFPCWL